MRVDPPALSRRSFLLAGTGLTASAQSALDVLSAAYSGNPVHADRRYRADATVTFLGISIFSRAGVGSCSISLDQTQHAASGARAVAIRFAAGSAPDKARGLNRLGYIQELVIERGAASVESAYFGFMTSSKEQSFDQAKAAMGATGKDAVPYTAVDGSSGPKGASYQLFDLLLPSSWNYSRCDELVRHVRETLARGQMKPSRSEQGASPTVLTFLYSIRRAMQSAQPKTNTAFLYNGKRYTLDAQRSADIKLGEAFASRKLAAAANRVARLNCTIQNQANGERTPFKLWYEQGRDFPIRFEYKARSFLTLAFELESA